MTQWLDWARQYPLVTPPVVADSVAAVQSLVAASHAVRPIGAGHSFAPLLTGGGTLLSLDGHTGIERIDRDRRRARVRAGSRIHELTAALHEEGLTLRNLGDIDRQTIAGATATATHGTGRDLPCLSAEIRGLELVRADGAVVEIDADHELLPAARVSLGALGVVTAVDLEVVPAHRLHRRTWSEPLESILETAPHRWAAHRNFEFFYVPHSDHGVCVAHDVTEAPIRPGPATDDDAALEALRWARTLLSWAPAVRRRIILREMARRPVEDAVDFSWRLLAHSRTMRFREMEYHLPVAEALPALGEVVRRVERDRPEVFFPIEVRQTAGDDGWISPFGDGPRISIAVHVWHRDDHAFLYDLLEPLFLAAGGRPHWGKLHSLSYDRLAALYPRFADFAALRESWDPTGKFLNDHLARMFDCAHARC